MSTIKDLVIGEAELDDEDDESVDEESGDVTRKSNGVKRTNGHMTDSSEEDEDDDNEEAAAAIAKDFIVDEEEEDSETKELRRQERKKRRREEREEEEAGLDEEDLDLIGEAHPEFERRVQTESKFKRLKRGHKDDLDARPGGVDDIFDIEEEDDRLADRSRRRGEDEFADFIEEDYGDEGGDGEEDDDVAVLRRPARNIIGVKEAAGLDEIAREDMDQVFGNGLEYDWALEAQEAADLRDESRVDPDDPDGLEKGIELKDVFEPSQLQDRMLTDEDNLIKLTDEPERFQQARKPYKDVELTESEKREEASWVANLLFPKANLEPSFRDSFQKAVAKALDFMNNDGCEVPFIFQHRKDYLIEAREDPPGFDSDKPNSIPNAPKVEKLLTQSDLWDVYEHDLKFRALLEKRHSLQRTYDNLQGIDANFSDPVIEESLPEAISMEELQDIQDYLHFQHSGRLADMAILEGTQQNGGTHRRPGASKVLFERIRNSRIYGLVRAFGITADAFAQNALKRESRRQYTEDPPERPDDLADSEAILDPPDYSSGAQCLRAAKAMFAEEIFMSPRMRKFMRGATFMNALIDCRRTEKGARKIDDQHPYYEIKYLRNQRLGDIAQDPARFLRMLKAEEEGLLEVRVRIQNRDSFVRGLYRDLESDNSSEVADAWNRERREVLDMALAKLEKVMTKSLKEGLRTECENQVGRVCRDAYNTRLDQAPYKPKGMQLGTVPNVLAISNGSGSFGRDAIVWAWVSDEGKVLDNGKFKDLTLGDPERGTNDGEDVDAFVELVQRRKPDVIGVSGFSTDTRKLLKQLEDIVERKDLRCADFEDDDGNPASERLDVVIVNDEIARLYQTSDRAATDYPSLAPLTRYCIGLAKYLQGPLIEYAALGRDITSISFDPNQHNVPTEKLLKQLEYAIVDMVNLVGVDINDAVSDPSILNLLQYVGGLGPRKAMYLQKVINANGGEVITRNELAEDPDDQTRKGGLGPRVWNNCASFVYIPFNNSDPDGDYLDNTRVHPEDYDIGRKMASDALELDEEDIDAEINESGPGAVVRKLIREDAQDKVNDLVLEEYAEQLEQNFNQRKRATLETIRAELQQPYEELRRNFALMSHDEVFTMLTGETRESVTEGMVVPVSIKKIADDYLEVRMDCGIEGVVPATSLPSHFPTTSLRQLYTMHQTVQAKILMLNRKHLSGEFSLREDDVSKPYKREYDRGPDEWDDQQERQDVDAMREKAGGAGRTQRVIKHPLFRPFNATQAEEFLGSQGRGDLVIRPSSKGMNHLAVTWKVSDNVYQHIDVLELGKSNELTQGTTLRVGGRYNYSDLDELIVNHVKAMAKKVDEMMLHEKYQNTSRSDTGKYTPSHHHSFLLLTS